VIDNYDPRAEALIDDFKGQGSNDQLTIAISVDMLDTGIDVRTVVSGISEYFEPGVLIGKQICLLANLEPREIKGIQSQGMILLAEDASGKLVFVTPEEVTKVGSEVK